MTVSSTTDRSGPYNGNGVTVAFEYEFRILDATHITVIQAVTATGVETVLGSSDYSVAGVGDSGGGSITLDTAPPTGQTITIIRNAPFTQMVDLENQGAYFAETIEQAFDLAAMRDQQLSERLDRSVQIPISADPDELDGLIEDIIRLADSAGAIDTVAGIEANVTAVAGNAANITTVAGVAASVAIVAGIAAAVTTVAGIAAAVTTVAGIAAAVVIVAGIAAAVSAVAANETNIDAVAANAANINAVAGIEAEIIAVPALVTAAENAATAADASADAAAVSAASVETSSDPDLSVDPTKLPTRGAAKAYADGRLQGVLADDYAGVDPTGVADSTAGIVLAIAGAKALGSNVVYFTGGKYRITTGEILLTDIRLVGTCVPNLNPDGGSPFTYTEDNTTFLIDGTDPAFIMGVGWAIEGVSFWWPNQVGPTVDTAVPALFSSVGQNRSTRGKVRDCVIFNAYRVFDIDTLGVFGGVDFTNNWVFAIKGLIRLQGYMPEVFNVKGNLFSWGMAGSLVDTTGAALLTAHATSGIMIELDAGSGDEGQSMDGLMFEGNFVFGVNTFFRANTGQLSVSSISNNNFDAVPTVFSWNSTGICAGSKINDNLIYSYKFADTAAAQTVFETISGMGNAASEYTFNGNKITYAQGRVFRLIGTYASQVVAGNVCVNWARTTTGGIYPVFTNSGPTGKNMIAGNSFIIKDAPGGGVTAYGLQLASTVAVIGNLFDTVSLAVVVNGGTTRAVGNVSFNSPGFDMTLVGGSVGSFNDQNSWGNPSPRFEREFCSVLLSDFAGTNVATAQPVFGAAADEITIAADTTYEFEAEYFITRAAGTTSHTTGVLFGGTATFDSIDCLAQVTNPTGNVLGAVQQIWSSAATEVVLTAANTSATENLLIRLQGRIRTNAGGTLIPQFKYSAAPGGVPTIKRNSSFRIRAIGTDQVTINGPVS